MRIILAIAMLLAAAPAVADDWRTEDTEREALYLAIIAADYFQTRQIMRECEAGLDRREINPFLPDCPRIRHLNSAIASTIAGHLIIARALSHEWRGPFQRVTIFVHGAVVLHNLSIGLTGTY